MPVSFEWNGNWSDNSSLWTEDIKRALDVTLSADDGAFWMVGRVVPACFANAGMCPSHFSVKQDFEDFLRYFRGVNVCMERRDHQRWKEARKKGTFTFNRGKVFQFAFAVPIWFVVLLLT